MSEHSGSRSEERITSEGKLAASQGLYRGIVLAVSQRLAGRIRANESNWPVRTGYSRSRWRGNQEGLTNDASYAKQLEATRGEPALTFVTRNLQRELDKEIRNRDR